MKWYNMLVVASVSLCVLHSSHGLQEDTSMDIHSLHIDCKVTSRFAHAVITTEVRNPLNTSREAIFDVELPKTAFIANFSMTVNGVTSVGTVKEKAEAKQQYQKAVSKGQSAGLVQSTGRKMENFKVSVNVAAGATVTFKLTYEELLKRYLGNYELYLRVRPKQLVQNFQINVDIIEPQGISFLNAHGTFITNELTDVVKTNRTDTKAHIVFKPTLDQQRTCPACAETLLNGDFVIKYDVKRNFSAGNIQTVNGYFVHYFAPTDLQRVPKNVMFVIDRSGSMHGQKIKQTFEAFLKILEDMPPEDFLGILAFDDKVETWKTSLVKAVPANIEKAKQFVSKITARGGTDINRALLSAMKMLRNATINKVLPEISTSIILFLSDGEPTSGISNQKEIMDNVKRAIEGQSTLYCLGFGNDVDYNFLEKLALQNGGVARRIYEDSDSALQLQGFYNEVAYPMLLDIHLHYLDNSVADLTESNFRHYYQGSEIIVAGRITNEDLEILKAEVTAQGVSANFSMNVESNVKQEEDTLKEQEYIFGDFTERLWAYLSIEQLLTQQILAQGEEKSAITEKALHLSLKYNFVTPLTSMVITEDEDANKKLVANKPKEGAPGLDYGLMDLGHPDPIVAYSDNNDYNYYEAELPIHSVHIRPLIPSPTLSSSIPLIPSPTLSSSSCQDFHFLINVFNLTEKICLVIKEKQNTIINLFHYENSGITLNGEMIQGENNADIYFGKYGLLNKKMKLKVEITRENITVHHIGYIKTYQWTSSFEEKRFLNKEGEQIRITVETGIQLIISLNEQRGDLTLYIEDKHLLSNRTIGLAGQFFGDEKIHMDMGLLTVHGRFLPSHSENQCDFTRYGLEQDASCRVISIGTDGFISGTSYIVSDIFYFPHVTSYA